MLCCSRVAALPGSALMRMWQMCSGVAITMIWRGRSMFAHQSRRAAVGSPTISTALGHLGRALLSCPRMLLRCRSAASSHSSPHAWMGLPDNRDVISSRSMIMPPGPTFDRAHVLLPDAGGPHTMERGTRLGRSHPGWVAPNLPVRPDLVALASAVFSRWCEAHRHQRLSRSRSAPPSRRSWIWSTNMRGSALPQPGYWQRPSASRTTRARMSRQDLVSSSGSVALAGGGAILVSSVGMRGLSVGIRAMLAPRKSPLGFAGGLSVAPTVRSHHIEGVTRGGCQLLV